VLWNEIWKNITYTRSSTYRT